MNKCIEKKIYVCTGFADCEFYERQGKHSRWCKYADGDKFGSCTSKEAKQELLDYLKAESYSGESERENEQA